MKEDKILNINEELKKIVLELKENKNIVAVYIFGSRVTKKTTPLSDIDVCIIGDLKDGEKNKIERIFSEKYDLSFFSELPIWIKIRVFKQGNALYIKNKDVLYKILFETIRDYEDFKPIIMNRIKRRFGKCTI